MRCAPSNVTFLSHQLEDRGLARREPSARDRRQRVIRLTDAGADVRAELVREVGRRSPLAQLDDDGLRTLLQLLRHT